MNPRVIGIYQEHYLKSMEEKQRFMDYEAWLRGQYQVAAIGAALNGQKCKYPEKPFSYEEEEVHMSSEEQFILWIDAYNRRFDE